MSLSNGDTAKVVIDFLDPNVEPSDKDLDWLMMDTQLRATKKWERVNSVFWEDIKQAARAVSSPQHPSPE
ncbi:MAG: hypothetical protein OSA52_01095 [Yoonia sp.]|nr:hypothetical protein [Yoonia sp.]